MKNFDSVNESGKQDSLLLDGMDFDSQVTKTKDELPYRRKETLPMQIGLFESSERSEKSYISVQNGTPRTLKRADSQTSKISKTGTGKKKKKGKKSAAIKTLKFQVSKFASTSSASIVVDDPAMLFKIEPDKKANDLEEYKHNPYAIKGRAADSTHNAQLIKGSGGFRAGDPHEASKE